MRKRSSPNFRAQFFNERSNFHTFSHTFSRKILIFLSRVQFRFLFFSGFFFFSGVFLSAHFFPSSRSLQIQFSPISFKKDLAFGITSGSNLVEHRVQGQVETWLKEIDQYLIFSDEYNKNVHFSNHIVKTSRGEDSLKIDEAYHRLKERDPFFKDKKSHLWRKAQLRPLRGLDLLARKYPQAKWFILADDDTFIFVDRMIDRVLKRYDSDNEAVVLGSVLPVKKSSDVYGKLVSTIRFPHGGASYAISSKAMKLLVNYIDKVEAMVFLDLAEGNFWNSDILIGHLIALAKNVRLIHTEGFYCHLFNDAQMLYEYSQYPQGPLKDPISLHYVSPLNMKYLDSASLFVTKSSPLLINICGGDFSNPVKINNLPSSSFTGEIYAYANDTLSHCKFTPQPFHHPLSYIYQSYRTGFSLHYSILIDHGHRSVNAQDDQKTKRKNQSLGSKCKVVFMFSENDKSQPSQRIFAISIALNHLKVFQSDQIDVYAQVGNFSIYDLETDISLDHIDADQKSSLLEIFFTTVKGSFFLNGLTVTLE